MQTSRRPQKRCSSSPGLARPHPLVAPGDPPRRRPARPAAHPACPHHRLVMLATRPPSQCTTFASEAMNATVMLDRDLAALAGGMLPGVVLTAADLDHGLQLAVAIERDAGGRTLWRVVIS